MPKIVLVNPQIPPNTGNIARTCAATGCELHLVGPIGFELSDRYLKRAGLDYWPQVDLTYHTDLSQFLQHSQTIGGRQVGFSTAGKCSYIDFEFQPGDWLLFGSEGDGLPPAAVTQCDHLLRIPMPKGGVRSLNLSVSVGIGLFEALRQTGALTTDGIP